MYGPWLEVGRWKNAEGVSTSHVLFSKEEVNSLSQQQDPKSPCIVHAIIVLMDVELLIGCWQLALSGS